jgi:hypothetical protein
MVDRYELRRTAQARLEYAEALLRAGRYDGAVYICGYAVELVLKARIYETLNWTGYQSNRGEFQHYQTFRTHDLDILLSLSSTEDRIKAGFLTEWHIVASWNPELRYRPVGLPANEMLC